jgi:SAM-dependent methyltransferase
VADDPFEDRFGGIAGDYRRFRPRYPAPLFACLASLCRARRLAWDCACGSGQASVPLADHFARVVGTDASAGQLAAAPRLPNVEWRMAPAERSGLDAGTVDLVTVAQALHWLPVAAFHAEVERVLAPGGVYACLSYGRMRTAPPALDAALLHYHDVIVGGHWPAARRHVVEAYRELPFPYAPLPTPPFEIAVCWSRAELLGYLGSWSATIACRAATGRDPLAMFAARLDDSWPRGAPTIEVRWPIALRVGRKNPDRHHPECPP